MKPLNAGSSDEEVALLAGNLAHLPFAFGGRVWASVEALYVALRTTDEAEREEISHLSGMDAKRRGRKLRKRGLAESSFCGRSFVLGSAEHHQVIKEAIRAKFQQHPELLAAFVDTWPRPIVHETGFPDSRWTHLPSATFALMLTGVREELRQELHR